MTKTYNTKQKRQCNDAIMKHADSVFAYRISRNFHISIILLMICLCIPGSAAKTDAGMRNNTGKPDNKNQVVAMGMAIITNSNIAMAKKRAVADAQNKGMENYLLNTIRLTVPADNLQGFVSRIIPKAKKGITSFKIMAEEQNKGIYTVMIRLNINSEIIRQYLESAGLLHKDMPAIKVLFMVSETRNGKTSYWWKDPEAYPPMTLTEIALAKTFQKRHMIPVDRTFLPPDINRYNNRASPDLQDADLVSWAKALSAGIVVGGHTIIEKDRITISLKAIDIANGITIYQDHQTELLEEHKNTDSLSSTMEQILDRTASKMASVIFHSARSGHETIHRINIELTGINSFIQSRAFKLFLKNRVAPVQGVRETALKQNSISFAIESEVKRDDLLRMILHNKDIPFSVTFIGLSKDSGIILGIKQNETCTKRSYPEMQAQKAITE